MNIKSGGYGKTVIQCGATSGVYFLKKGGEVVYIGKSNNVLPRVFGTGHCDKDFDEVEIHWMPSVELTEYERRQIKIHRPRLNVEGIKPRSRPAYLKLVKAA